MSKAVAFLAGLGAGYVRGDEQRRDNELRAARDAREQARFDADMADRATATANRDAITAAAKPVAVEPGTEFKPSMDAPVSTGDYKVGAQRFAERGAATTAATDYNSGDAVRKRVMATMASQGNVLGADQLRTSGIQGDAAQAALDETHHVQKSREFARGIVESFKNGWNGFAKYATDKYDDGNTYKAVEDGKGGAIVIATDKAGKEIGRQPFASHEDAIMYSVGRSDPTKYVDYKAGREDAANRNANAAAQLKVSQQQANTQEQYRRDQAGHMAAQDNAAKALREAEAKIPAAVKQQFASYDAELKVIGAAMAKAQAEGTFDPANPGVQSMMVRQRELMAKSEALLRPYLETNRAKDAPPPDKFGLRDAPAPKAATGWPANAPPGSTVRPTAATVAASGVAAPAAVSPAVAPTQDTGLEGLSRFALASVANDPSNPRSELARAMLEKMALEAQAATAATMAQPEYDPALYRN